MVIQVEISLEIKTIYIFWSKAFDPKEKFEGKVSKRLSYFLGRSKKVGPKNGTFLLYESLERLTADPESSDPHCGKPYRE